MNTETEPRDIPRTCNGLLLWIERQKSSHDLKPVRARDWSGSCKRILSFDDPGWEQKNPSDMDFGLLSDRARNAGMNAVTVKTYVTKAKEAIKNFVKFLENPSAYKSPVSRKRNYDSPISEIKALPAPAAIPATSPVEIHQGLSQDRHLHFHIHLSPEA